MIRAIDQFVLARLDAAVLYLWQRYEISLRTINRAIFLGNIFCDVISQALGHLLGPISFWTGEAMLTFCFAMVDLGHRWPAKKRNASLVSIRNAKFFVCLRVLNVLYLPFRFWDDSHRPVELAVPHSLAALFGLLFLLLMVVATPPGPGGTKRCRFVGRLAMEGAR